MELLQVRAVLSDMDVELTDLHQLAGLLAG